jgi:hypothetical protein
MYTAAPGHAHCGNHFLRRSAWPTSPRWQRRRPSSPLDVFGVRRFGVREHDFSVAGPFTGADDGSNARCSDTGTDLAADAVFSDDDTHVRCSDTGIEDTHIRWSDTGTDLAADAVSSDDGDLDDTHAHTGTDLAAGAVSSDDDTRVRFNLAADAISADDLECCSDNNEAGSRIGTRRRRS